MAEAMSNQLSNEIISLLQRDRFVLLGTIDHETKGPNVNAISWVYALNPVTVRFALDNRSRLLLNIKSEPNITLTLFAEGSVYTISGVAKVIEEKISEVQIKLAKVEVQITAVRNVMFYGSKISQEPLYEKTYDEELAKKLDNQVFDALKKA